MGDVRSADKARQRVAVAAEPTARLSNDRAVTPLHVRGRGGAKSPVGALLCLVVADDLIRHIIRM